MFKQNADAAFHFVLPDLSDIMQHAGMAPQPGSFQQDGHRIAERSVTSE